MKLELKRQQFLNHIARVGWYPVEIKAATKGKNAAPEERVYMTTQGVLMRVVLDEQVITMIEEVGSIGTKESTLQT